MASPVVEIQNVSKVFNTSRGLLTALQCVSFDVADGEFISLIGPSGCGKSTILRLVSDIHQPTSGKVIVTGESPRAARKDNRVNFMFQEPVLLPWASVYKNVMLALDLTCPDDHPDPMETIEFVGLKGRENDYPYQLSGGMQQRVALARALITNPKVLLMDEPFAALDEITRDKMGRWLLSIWEKTKRTVIFVTHSIPEAIFLSDRVIVMDAHPGCVRADLTIPFPRPRLEEIREEKEFFELYSIVKAHLREAEASEEDQNE